MANLGPVKDDDIFDETGGDDDIEANTPPDPAPDDTPPEPAPEPEGKGSEPEPEPAPEPAPKNPAADAPDGYVPHQALHQQRLINQQLQESLDAANQRLASVDQIKAQLDELRKAGKSSSTEDPAPDKEADPIAFLEWENRQMRRDLDAIKQKESQAEEQQQLSSQQQEQVKKFMGTVRDQVLEFEKAQPDYSQAFMFVLNRRMKEYEAMGITDPQEKQMTFDREVMQVAGTAMQRRINPGQAMYDLARMQGYTKKAAPDPDPNDKGASDSLAAQMDRLEKGNRAGSMANGGGAAPETPLSIADIEAMSDDEFDAWWDKQTGGNSIY